MQAKIIHEVHLTYSINHIFKPRRLLYYIQATETDITNMYLGIIPEIFNQYIDAFGTYDCPGIFRIRTDEINMRVIGMEFRMNDSRVIYPANLEHMELSPSFMMGIDITSDISLDCEKVESIIQEFKPRESAQNNWPYIFKEDIPKVVEVFTLENKNRIYVSAKATEKSYRFIPETPQENTHEELYKKAYLDPITGYFNWNHIKPYLEGFGLKGIQDFAFVHFDVKDFKTINEIYSHHIANNLLRRITKKITEQDWIYQGARCDNDNFALMIKDMPDEEIREKLTVFFDSLSTLPEDPTYNIYFRCGVVPMRNSLLLSDRVPDGAKLVQKMGNKLNSTEIIFYTDKIHDEILWGKKIKTYLNTAIANDEFLVYLQPKYDINTEQVIGAEALVRWNYQKKGLLPPIKFIPFLEREGSIGKVDDIVLHKVCQYLKRWKDEKIPLHPISVNLSRKQLEKQNLIEHLTNIVDTYQVPHQLIDFELTESATINNQIYMMSILSQLKEKGFRISIDDFGTGYSSLSMLTEMPLDTLKIDKSFVDGIDTDTDTTKECTIVKCIISMAKELNFHCLAEGAETQKQIDKLRHFGCETIQGYYYSKPLPVEEYELKLKEK